MLAIIRIFQTDQKDTTLVTSRHTSVIFKMAGKYFLFVIRCKGCQFPECLDSSFAFFNNADHLKNNMEIFAIRFSRKKFQKHHMRQRKVPRSVYKLAQFV